MLKWLPFFKRTAWVTFAVLWFSACTLNTGKVDFPAGESEFTQPVSRPFKFGEPITIQWEVVDPNSLKPLSTKKFDFAKIPSKPFDIGYAKALTKPLDQTKFDWNNLPDTTFELSSLSTQKLRFKTIFMEPPTMIKSGYPTAKLGATRGVMEIDASLGLPGNGRCFLKSQDGLIWIGTDNGLCRYDGVNLEIYGLEQGIWDPNIWSIAEDQKGRIWIGTLSGDVFVLDRKAGLILQLADTFPRGPGYGLMCDRDGQLWIVRNGQGVIIVNENDQTVKMFGLREGLPDNFTLKILQDRKGRIWLSTSAGATILDLRNNIRRQLSKSNGLSEDPIFAIMEDDQGNIWLGGNGGVHKVNPEKGIIQRLWKNQGLTGATQIFGFLQDKTGNVWISSDAGKLFWFDQEKGRIEKFDINSGPAVIYSILEDNEGQLWLGTANNGSYSINLKRGRPGNFTPANGLGSNAVWSVVEARNGLIWLGTANGIDVYDRATQSVRHLGRENVLTIDARMNHLFEDSQGQIWAVGNSSGISIINSKEGIIKYLGPDQGLPNSNVQRIMEDREGQVWIGTADGEVYFYEPEKKLLKKISNLTSWKNGIVRHMLKDSAGQLWLCGGNEGAIVIDVQRKTMRSLKTSQGLLSNTAYNALEAADGAVWVGTSKGLNRLDLTKQTIAAFTTQEGLVHNEVWTLNERDGAIYVGTTRGLSIVTSTPVDKALSPTWTITNYGKTQGLAFLDFDLNSAVFTKNGEFWAGVEIEVLMVMDDPLPDPTIPTTRITGIEILDQPQTFGDRAIAESQLQDVDTLWKAEANTFYENPQVALDARNGQSEEIRWDSVEESHHLPVNLTLPHNENYLTFSFAGTTFSNPDQVKYRYMLEGIDKNWSPISANTQSENYRDLPSGKYAFKVCSKGMNGLWSTPATFSFTITPPWWKSWWAFAGYFLSFLGVGWRVHLFQKEQTVRHEREKIRERELVQAKEIEKAYHDLQATQSQLIQSEKMASLGELTAGIAHEIQNPLNFVNNFSEVNKELLQEMSDELNQGRTEDAKAIAKSVMENEEKILFHGRRADSIVKGMLQHSRASSGMKESTDISALADEYLRLAYHGLRAKDKSFNATMKTDFDASLGKVNVVPQDLGRVILNLITNGFYAVMEKKQMGIVGYEPTVTVVTKKTGNQVTIAVQDNGNGIPQSIQDKIYQPFFTTKPAGKGTGLGLSLSYDIVKSHGGEIKVETQEGKGTRFTIILPE